MTEKEKFNLQLQEKISHGLKNIGFVINPNSKVGEEEFYAELNRMYEAKDMPDPEVLGKYDI